MEHKGNIWILIFFIILFFLFTTTLDIDKIIDQSEEIELKAGNGKVVDSTVLPSRTSGVMPEGRIKYKEFMLDYRSGDNLTLFMDVNNQWMEYKAVSPESIKVFNYDNTSDTWKEIPISSGQRYAVSTLYTTKQVNNREYLITGEKDSAEQTGRLGYWHKFFIMLASIIILLFIGYYKPKKNRFEERKKNLSVKQLEEYVKKSLMNGQKEEALRDQLISAGWDRKKIDEMIRKSRYF